jgi:hypothetical protein
MSLSESGRDDLRRAPSETLDPAEAHERRACEVTNECSHESQAFAHAVDKASFTRTVRVGHCGHGTFWEGLLGVRLRLSDPELADNLRDFLERRECAVVQVDAETLEVEFPHELHAKQARMELDLYLRVWQSLHEWSAVDYVEKL